MFEKEIALGMETLDKHFKEEQWWRKINLEELDISNIHCVLFQLFGDQDSGMEELGLDPNDNEAVVERGWYVTDSFNRKEELAVLTQEWKEAIKEKMQG